MQLHNTRTQTLYSNMDQSQSNMYSMPSQARSLQTTESSGLRIVRQNWSISNRLYFVLYLGCLQHREYHRV